MTGRTANAKPEGSSAYRRLAEDLRELVRQDAQNGLRLPTEAELAETYRLGRQTVRRAMQELVNEGLIYRVAGKGTFPVPRTERSLRYFGSVEDLMETQDTTFRVVVPLHRRIDVEAAARLRQPTDTVMALAYLRLTDDSPMCYTSVRVPTEIGRMLEDVPELHDPTLTSDLTILGLLDKRLDQRIDSTDQSISVSTVPSFAASELESPAGGPALRIDRTFNLSEQPIELSTSWFPGDRYSYRIRLNRTG